MNFNKFLRISMNFKRKVKAFTLMELLIYSSILVISVGLMTGIVYNVSKISLKTQVNEELNNQSIRFEEVFRQKIQIAKGINSISGSLLSLEMNDENKNPTIFTLTDNVAYIQEGSGSQVALNDIDKVKVTSLAFASARSEGASISDTYHYAWNDQVGWIDFAYSGGNLQVPVGEGDLSGLAYVPSDSHWISLNCLSTESCETVDYKVSSDVDGNLSGWAWSEYYGWISFNCLTDNTCAFSDYKVTVDQDTGEFDGYAYSENIGWISFNCKTGGTGQTDICSTSDYKIEMATSISIGIDIILQYNSDKPESAITRVNSFVFNMISPFIPTTTTITTTTTEPPTTTTTVSPEYYCDNDGDDYYTTTTYSSCTGSSRTSPAGDDCDDTDIAIYPGTSGGSTCSLCNSDGSITYQTSEQDLFNECTISSDCATGNCKGGIAACGYNTTSDGACPTCKTCSGATSVSCLNYTNNAQDSGCNSTCQACQSGSCSVATAGTDPGSQCGTTDCYTGNCKGGTAVCGYYITGEGNCAVCKYCEGATSGTCVNRPNDTQDTAIPNLCNATCYYCNGAGSCVDTGVTLTCYPDSDDDGYGATTGGATYCGSCPVGTSLSNTDCCDSDNRAYPGEGTYYSSTNNCGSWDYDCSGTTNKSDCDVRTITAYIGCRSRYYGVTCASTWMLCDSCTYSGVSYLSCGATGVYYYCMTLAHYGEAGGPCEAKQYAKNDDSSGYTRNCVCK